MTSSVNVILQWTAITNHNGGDPNKLLSKLNIIYTIHIRGYMCQCVNCEPDQSYNIVLVFGNTTYKYTTNLSCTYGLTWRYCLAIITYSAYVYINIYPSTDQHIPSYSTYIFVCPVPLSYVNHHDKSSVLNETNMPFINHSSHWL